MPTPSHSPSPASSSTASPNPAEPRGAAAKFAALPRSLATTLFGFNPSLITVSRSPNEIHGYEMNLETDKIVPVTIHVEDPDQLALIWDILPHANEELQQFLSVLLLRQLLKSVLEEVEAKAHEEAAEEAVEQSEAASEQSEAEPVQLERQDSECQSSVDESKLSDSGLEESESEEEVRSPKV